MLVKDVDITKIEKLLNSVPDDMEVYSISFIGSDYILNFKKSLSNIKSFEYETLLNDLKTLIKSLDCNQE